MGLLFSLLLPSLTMARQKSFMALCVSNFKEIGTGIALYTNANKGILPGPLKTRSEAIYTKNKNYKNHNLNLPFNYNYHIINRGNKATQNKT